MGKTKSVVWLWWAWAIAVIAVFGCWWVVNTYQLVLSELCWYQRVIIFSLAIVLSMGVIKRDKIVAYYALPLSLIGAGLGIYQNFFPRVCTAVGSACGTVLFSLGNWGITPPVISLVVMILISIFLWLAWRARD
ncbi:MAG: hypothetical protein V1826_01180 [bacterium]